MSSRDIGNCTGVIVAAPLQAPTPGYSYVVALTTDPTDPRLGHGVDEAPIPQHDTYLVLSEEEREKGFVRPYRDTYIHAKSLGGCGVVTHMGLALSETYARDPHFYGATYCVGCRMHKAVGANGEFLWDGTDEKVGT